MSLLVSNTFLSFTQKGHLGLSERVSERRVKLVELLLMSKVRGMCGLCIPVILEKAVPRLDGDDVPIGNRFQSFK